MDNRSNNPRWLLIIIGVVAAVSAVCLIFWLTRGQPPEESLVVQQTVPPAATATLTATPTATATLTPIPTATLTPTLTPTPTPSPIPAPPGATIGFCYRVQPGETIYSLAQKFETSRYAINLVNDLYPPDLVYAHQTLFIPIELGRGPNIYIVQQGDTLTSIAEKCRLPASMIAGVNKLDPDITLREGDAIDIPIPPFPPPSRFNYPTGLLPLVPYPPTCCKAFPPYRPGPPLHK